MNKEDVVFALTLFSTLGSGLIAGVFFAFSTFVMSALGRLPAAQGIATMQSINVTVISPLFMTAFAGTAAICIILTVISLFLWQQPYAVYLLAGSVLYFVGTFLVTMLFNVPRNNALAAVDPVSVHGATLWARFLVEWTAWNHVRTVMALTASILFTISIFYLRGKS